MDDKNLRDLQGSYDENARSNGCLHSGDDGLRPCRRGTDHGYNVHDRFRFQWQAFLLFVALDKGFYKAEGLNVNIIRGQGSIDAVKKVATGAAQIGFADAGAVILARANDSIPVKLVAIIYAKPPHAVFALADSGIKTPKDLEGRTVADAPFGAQRLIFNSYALAAGIDTNKVKWIRLKAPPSPRCWGPIAWTQSANSSSANR